MDGQGNLERTRKIREKSGNLRINGYGKFIYSVQGKGCTFSCSSISPSPSALGATLNGKNWLPRGANSSFKSNPQIRSDTVTTIKIKNKNDFFLSVRG